MEFSLSAYKTFLCALKEKNFHFVRFKEILKSDFIQPQKICLIRHDVDRKPKNALNMAILEHSLGIKSTYYFRIKKSSFDSEIMKKIEAMEHEVGYHYENLSDTNGDLKKGLIDFENNLAIFKKVADVKTISMHGRPLKPHDNRDLWKIKENHKLLGEKFGILGEVYLDIDYSDIAYINDTGRNWRTNLSNRRDHVDSKIPADFESSKELLDYLSGTPHPKICFQIHPERWTDNKPEWIIQYTKDLAINTLKKVLS
jgi:hypothetical protein